MPPSIARETFQNTQEKAGFPLDAGFSLHAAGRKKAVAKAAENG